MALKARSISLNLPFGIGGVTLELSDAGKRAAWALYVEFATRVSTYPLEPGAGSMQDALDSLYSLFATTREVLREAGPEVGGSPNALGPLAIRILNEGVRPFLVSWRTERTDDQATEPGGERRAEFDRELEQLRDSLEQYVDSLARIAGVAPDESQES